MDIKKELLKLRDAGYRDFHASLMPTVEKEKIIGVRIPHIKSLAKKIRGTAEACEFLQNLPHQYYEENNLHAFLIAQIGDFDKCIEETNRFLPYVDNWATCDSLRPKCFKLNTGSLIGYIYEWIKSDKPYTVRFGIEMLMLYYLDEEFLEEYLYTVSKIRSDEYYVNMMIAWYFATALAKQYEHTLPYIESRKLPLWIHNKTIQKAIESNRISNEKKLYLKSLKQK